MTVTIYCLYDVSTNDYFKYSRFLHGNRKARYDDAIRLTSKRQILISSLLQRYVVTKELSESRNIDIKLNSRFINNDIFDGFYHSNTHSGGLFVYAIDQQNTVAVDAEEKLDRGEYIYNKLINKNKELFDWYAEKDRFYRIWLTKEIAIKFGEKDLLDISKNIRFIEIENYIIGVLAKEVYSVKIILVKNDELIRYCESYT